MLGHLVHNEQAEDAAHADPSDNENVRRQKERLRKGHREARREQFSDLGFQ